jgi:hypothetical protein
MRMKWIALAALGTLTALSGQASANSWKFNVANLGNVAVVEFRTQEDGEWSENWIERRIEPGDKIELDFETAEGNCEVRTQVRLLDGAYFDAGVDYCKARNLEILTDTLVWKP